VTQAGASPMVSSRHEPARGSWPAPARTAIINEDQNPRRPEGPPAFPTSRSTPSNTKAARPSPREACDRLLPGATPLARRDRGAAGGAGDWEAATEIAIEALAHRFGQRRHRRKKFASALGDIGRLYPAGARRQIQSGQPPRFLRSRKPTFAGIQPARSSYNADFRRLERFSGDSSGRSPGICP